MLDTSALSLLSPDRPSLPAGVADRLRGASDRLYVSTVTVAEIREGIAKLRRKGAMGRANAIEAWFVTLRYVFAERVLPFGIDEAEESGALADCAVGIGRHLSFADVAIAGIAKAHRLAVVTGNGKHVEPLAAFGVVVTDLAGMA
nr:PIN domain-containing protein [Aureimonas jatrophae]